MANINIQTLKGFRDFLPNEARKRQYVINILKQVFESYGFEPLETPTLEYEEILTGKYGDEGDKLMYRFVDNGGRRVAMRYDQTVPLARVVAQYQKELPFPFKRYQIQPVWRAENTQRGRFREFLQCDIDIAGTASPLSDAEIIAVVAKAYEKLGFKKYKILINDRSLFAGLPTAAIVTIDKLKKIGPEKVKEELKTKNIDPSVLDQLLTNKPTEYIDEVITCAKELGVEPNQLTFEPTLARGLNYYTGIIIEVEIEGYTVGSVGGGGRYDNLIGMFLPNGKKEAGRQVPAVGFSFGFDRVIDAMEERNLFPKNLVTTKVLVTIFSPTLKDKSIAISSRLREVPPGTSLRSNSINTELYLDETAKMEKQLKYADQKNIPYVVIVGPEEAAKNTIMLRDMKTREQKEISIEELIKMLQ